MKDSHAIEESLEELGDIRNGIANYWRKNKMFESK